MPFHRKLLRKIIPKEIREPISKVTEAIEKKVLDPVSDVTEKIEDAVRPVTDPVRKFISKALPNTCLLYTSPSPRDGLLSRMSSSA